MSKHNLLESVPAEYIAVAARSLLDATKSEDETQQTIIRVKQLGDVVITFRRCPHKLGNTIRWFWIAQKAERA